MSLFLAKVKMNEIEKKYAVYCNKTTPHKLERRKGQKDPQTAVTDLMKKLNMWREDSQSQFVSILNCYTSSINMGINNLMEEVCDLQDQLAATTKERNDLIELLNGEIKHQITKSPLTQPNDDSNQQAEDSPEEETQDTERPQTNSNTGVKEDRRDKIIADHKFKDKQDKYPLGDMDLLNVLTLSELTHAGLHNIELVAADDKVINNIELVASDDNVTIGKNDEMDLDQEEPTQMNKMEGTTYSEKIVQSEDHVCSQCNLAFYTNDNLINHLKSVHLNSEPSEQCRFPRILRAKEVNPAENNELIGQGNNPSEAVIKSETGNNHEVQLKQQWLSFINKGGETKFRCGHCPYTSGKKCDIERHGEQVHAYVGNLVCKICGYAASQKSALKTHIERVHEKIRKYVCQDCGHATSEKKSLQKHIDVVHDKIRNHTCDQCDYVASQSHHLKDHVLSVHKQLLCSDGSAIFNCEKCSYSSKVQSHVKSHVKRVHKIINKDDQDKAGRVIQVIKLTAPK